MNFQGKQHKHTYTATTITKWNIHTNIFFVLFIFVCFVLSYSGTSKYWMVYLMYEEWHSMSLLESILIHRFEVLNCAKWRWQWMLENCLVWVFEHFLFGIVYRRERWNRSSRIVGVAVVVEMQTANIPLCSMEEWIKWGNR